MSRSKCSVFLGIYQLEVVQTGFARASDTIEIHSSIATEFSIPSQLRSVNQSVTTSAANTLVGPDQAGGEPDSSEHWGQVLAALDPFFAAENPRRQLDQPWQ
jgi:hypothetical protein